ncbi:MAG: HAD family hydrolase [Desulfobacteraceae bacterium]|nr:HAD family hydrolase [Desulfobacteraceae bacterium]
MLIWFGAPSVNFSRFLLLDRDGVININRADYVKNIEEVEFYPDALEALGILRSRSVGVALVSNQSGIHRGFISWKDFWEMHEGVVRKVESCGGEISAAFYCPHRPDENCECRKPLPEMILSACRFFRISPERTYFAGDRETDVRAAANAGCEGIRICREGIGPSPECCESGARCYEDLLHTVLDLFPESG